MSATTYGWLVLAFPLAGSLDRSPSAGGRCPAARPGWIGTPRSASRSCSSVGALVELLDHPVEERQLASSLYDYASAAGLDIQLGILVDPLSVLMCLVVTGVSTLIHLYSVAYMTSDQGFRRYFSYLNFFVFSMLLLVLAGNFVLLIVGWAFVGFASYALISFWYRRDTATTAGMKAFVINVIGDIGLVFAAFLHLPRARHLRLPRGLRGGAGGVRAERAARSSRSACCSASAPSRSRRSCRSTPGCRTRWRARPRSPR